VFSEKIVGSVRTLGAVGREARKKRQNQNPAAVVRPGRGDRWGDGGGDGLGFGASRGRGFALRELSLLINPLAGERGFLLKPAEYIIKRGARGG